MNKNMTMDEMMIAMEFLNWNRCQPSPYVKIGYELPVWQVVVEIYEKHIKDNEASMSEKPEAIVLADIIDSDFDPDWMYEVGYDRISAELRRLHEAHEWQYTMAGERLRRIEKLDALNAELGDALRLAVDAHGLMMMSDPPQEAWKVWEVESKARAVLAKLGNDDE